MAKQEKVYYFLALSENITEHPVESILDMLRYDSARVENNPPTGFYLFSKPEKYGVPTDKRWATYGLFIFGLQPDELMDIQSTATKIKDEIHGPGPMTKQVERYYSDQFAQRVREVSKGWCCHWRAAIAR